MENPFDILKAQLDRIENRLSQLQMSQTAAPDADSDAMMTSDQAAAFLQISRSTLYDNIKNIPHIKRFGRHYFFKSELLDYLKEGIEPATSDPIYQTRRTRKRKMNDE